MHCFIHIPSTAGTTAWSVLRKGSPLPVRRLGTNDISENERRARELIADNGAELSVVGGHVRYGFYEQPTPPLRYITFLRNPVDRLVSTYFRKIRNEKHVPSSQAAFESWSDLLEFLEPRKRGALAFLLGRERSNEVAELPAAEQVELIIDHVERCYDFVGIAEAFDTSIYYLARELGWPRVPLYDRRNRGGNKRRVPDGVRRDIEALLDVEVGVYEHFRAALLARRRRDHWIAQASCALHGWRGEAYRRLSALLVPGYATRYVKGGRSSQEG